MGDHYERRDNSEVIEALGELKGATLALTQTVARLDRRLYGNGQPGDIRIITERIDAVERNQTRSAAWVAGAVAVLTLIGGAAEFLWHYVFGKKG